jgi:hypothetical protein
MNSSELADKKQVDHDGAIDDTEDEDNSTQCSDFISLLDESFDVLNAGRTHQSFHESYQGWIYGNGGTRKESCRELMIGCRFRKARKLVRVAYKFDNGWQTGKW